MSHYILSQLRLILAVFTLVISISTASWAKELSFEDALDSIIRQSYALKAGEEREQGLYDSHRKVRLWYLPTLTLGVEQDRTQLRSLDYNTNLSSPSDHTGYSSNLNYNLYRFGGDTAALDQAQFDEQKSDYQNKSTLLDEERDAYGKLITLVNAKELLVYQKRNQAIQLDTLEMAKKRYQKGLLSREDVERTAIDLDRANIDLKERAKDVAEAAAALRPYLQEEEVKSGWPFINKFKNSASALGKEHNSDINDHPSVKAIDLAVKSAEKSIEVAKSALYPSLDLGVSYQQNHYSPQNAAFASADTLTGQLTLTIPVFDKLANYGNYRSQIHEKYALTADLQNQKQKLTSSYLSIRARFLLALETTKEKEHILESYAHIYQRSVDNFKEGRIKFDDLLMDEKNYYGFQQEFVNHWRGLHSDLIELCHMHGTVLKECFLLKEVALH